MVVHQSSEDSQAVEIREDVLSLTTDWFSAFELRFFPGLAAKLGVAAVVGGDGGEGHTPMAGGFAPLPISRILSEVRLGSRVHGRNRRVSLQCSDQWVLMGFYPWYIH